MWEFSAFKKSRVAVVPAELEKKDGEIGGDYTGPEIISGEAV